MRTEAAVIGAGPAGLIAATNISKQGYSVSVFEEHQRVGFPVHCAGMISVEGFKRLDIMPDPVFHQNTIYGGKVYSCDGSFITIRDKKPRAYIIDRGPFDGVLAEKAQDSGVDLRLGKRVDAVNFKDGCAQSIKVDASDIQSTVFVDAEGARGRVLARSGIETGQVGVFNGFNVEFDVAQIESDMVEVWFSREYSKNFFTWVIPLSETRVRCGLATNRNNGVDSLRRFIRKRFDAQPCETIHGGLVCTGGPVEKTAYNGLLLTGDVAGQVKPTTAGGVIIGGLCARLAGDACVKALEAEDISLLGGYERDWRRLYGSELQTMLMLRRLLNKVDDERMNRIFHACIEESLESKFISLVEQGDMDMQADVIKRALTDPAILGALVKSMGRFALSEVFAALGF